MLDCRGEPFVTLVDIVRDSVIAQGVRAGDGPGEVRHPTAMWRTRAGELVLFEPNRRRVMLAKDVLQPTQSQLINLPVARAAGVLPPEGALLSGAGTLVTGQFGDTTVLVVPADPREPQRVMLEGPNRRADVDPAKAYTPFNLLGAFCMVEGVKSVSQLFMPVSGEVPGINGALDGEPALADT